MLLVDYKLLLKLLKDFDRMMKYAKRELELYDIDESSVVSFTIKNKSAQWEMGIRREK